MIQKSDDYFLKKVKKLFASFPLSPPFSANLGHTSPRVRMRAGDVRNHTHPNLHGHAHARELTGG
jgi:hypothetical protein